MSYAADQTSNSEVPPALNFTVKNIVGEDVSLAKYEGKVLLVVNVASKCGLTTQYKGLEALHEKYGEQGLAVLGFPCNQFLGQEPAANAQILQFCKATYNVQFDMFGKLDVNGKDQAPFYKYLKSQEVEPKGSGDVGWNFEKFVIDRHGKVIARFSPRTEPDDPAVVKVIEAALAEK